LANLRNDVNSLDALNHEMGHCVYDLGISRDLTVIDRAPASSALTEAIAMMMGDLAKKENILKNIIPEYLLIRFKKSISKDEANFISKSLLIIDFERELYKNPNQNPAELWADLRLKYRNQNHAPNNEWATIPHYLSHPVYYQNYFRAALMKAQIYKHLQKTLGNITENIETANYLRNNIFSKGASIEEYELIKQLTGKNFNAKDYISTL
jgi:oligoendopeptidase F